MTKKVAWNAASLILLVFAAICLEACTALPIRRESTRKGAHVETATTPHGLRFYLEEDHTIPLVTIDMWVRVGSGDEPVELAGISHFLEHMLFKGTERLAVGEYDRRVEGLGGYLNAATSADYTHYFVTLPSEHFDRIIGDFADVMMNSSLASEEVDRERLVILEEIRRKNDSPFGYLFDNALPAVFSSGPYRHPVIGNAGTVGQFTQEQLLDHYKRFYTADRMTLCIVGDIDSASVRGRLGEVFAELSQTSRPYREETPATEFAPPGNTRLPGPWKEAYFAIAFEGPAASNVARVADADLVATLLAGGRKSRLINSLQEKKGLVSSIGVYFPTNRSPMPCIIYGTCEPGRLEEVRKAIAEELRILREDGFGASELKRVRRQVLNSHLYSLETTAGRAATLGYSQIVLGGPGLIEGYEDAIRRADSSDLKSFIKRYLNVEDSSFFVTTQDAGAGIP